VVHEAEAAEDRTGRIDRLVARASVAAEEVRAHGDATGAVGVREAAERRAHAAREAWRCYGERVDTIAAEAEARLVEARNELDVELAESQSDLHDATARLLDQWTGRLDDLRVQAALARMEAADEADPAVARVEERVRAAARRAAALREGSEESLDLLRTGVVEAFELVREGFDEALLTMRRAARAGR
jgi:hypothetical protein